jgi:uncharacterized membrane protein
MIRRGYLDWMRGVAALLMVEAHTFDAWTRPQDRDASPYRTAIFLGGFAAPAFLFLAGVALALAARARVAKGRDLSDVAAQARARGWQVFGLAFLFRLQSLLVSGGQFPQALFKVDILNVLGLSMVGAGWLWSRGATRRERAFWLGGAAVLLVAVAPFVRTAAWPSSWPDWLEMYVRSFPGRTSFSLAPWPAFLFVGAVVGDWLVELSSEHGERTATNRVGLAGGLAVVVGGIGAFLPGFGGWYASWTVAPTLFIVRLGLLCLGVWASYRVFERPGSAGRRSVVREFGVASLFIYWVHVELAYGRPAQAWSRSLSLPEATWGYLGLCSFLYGLVRLKTQVGRLTKIRGKSGKFDEKPAVSA